MKVLLVDPPQVFLEGSGATRQIQPLGIGYIGAVIAPHHDVRFLLPDTRSYSGEHPWDEIAQVIRDEAPDLVGVTAVTATFPSARKLAEVVKAIDPEIWTVLGGVHATVEPAQSLQTASAFDFIVRGEGEHTLSELLSALERMKVGDPFKPENIRGLVFRDQEGEIRQSQSRPAITDLDSLPFPLREQLVWSDNIHNAFYQGMVTLRGCPFQCIYCAIPSREDRAIRYRSPRDVVDEISELRAKHEIPSLFFHDSVFTIKRDRTIAICRSMIERNQTIPYYCQTRADLVDGELLDHMVEAGCSRIMFGIESGDESSLKLIGKRMSLDTIIKAVRMVKARDIRCTGFFMVGFPWETRELMEKTADFATSLELDAVNLFPATPLPGTELWDLADNDHFPDCIDFRTPTVNLTKLSDSEYAQLFAKLKERIDAYNQAQMYKTIDL